MTHRIQLTQSEAAKIVGVCYQTLGAYVRRGLFDGLLDTHTHKRPRFYLDTMEEVARLVRTHKRLQADAPKQDVIVAMLAEMHGNVADTARVFGLSKQGFYRTLARLGINPNDYRPEEKKTRRFKPRPPTSPQSLSDTPAPQ